jgi:hypothetical protein
MTRNSCGLSQSRTSANSLVRSGFRGEHEAKARNLVTGVLTMSDHRIIELPGERTFGVKIPSGRILRDGAMPNLFRTLKSGRRHFRKSPIEPAFKGRGIT